MLASKSGVASKTVKIPYRPTKWVSYFATVCLATVLLSATVQAVHFCASRGFETQTEVQSNPPSSGSSVCLTCLMAPAISALVLLIAFFIVAASSAFLGGLPPRLRPSLRSFQLYIRPPPFGLA